MIPQTSSQGFLHFCPMHANVLEQSALMVHSGLQLGGEPKYPGKHLQSAYPLRFVQVAKRPQGSGLHGSWMITGAGVVWGTKIKYNNKSITQLQHNETYFLK